MKKLNLFVVALVAVFGLNSCSKDCDFIEIDYSKDLVGTWTCLEPDYAAAYVSVQVECLTDQGSEILNKAHNIVVYERKDTIF